MHHSSLASSLLHHNSMNLIRPRILLPLRNRIAPAFGAVKSHPGTRISTGFRGYASSTVAMADRVHRITMFKAPKAEEQQRLMEQYKLLGANNKKDGKPYILSMVVGPAEADPRSQGFTLVSKTEFASMEDMKFYDDECVAHQQLKAFAQTLTIEGVMTVYFRPQVTGGCAP